MKGTNKNSKKNCRGEHATKTIITDTKCKKCGHHKAIASLTANTQNCLRCHSTQESD